MSPNVTKSRSNPTRAVVRAQLLVCVLTVGGASVAAQDEPAPSAEPAQNRVEAGRTALSAWIGIQQNIAREKRDWAVGREMLINSVGVYQRQIDSLQKRIAEAAESIGKADAKKVELVEENDRLDAALHSLRDVIDSLEARTKQLLPSLPDPIRERVKVFSQAIPADPAETKLALTLRFQNVIGLLNEVNKFSREITVASEVRQLGNGANAEVTAIYVGIGQGYYVTAKDDAAGVGIATPEGWVWTPANDAAPQIRLAVQILSNERAAEFVELPVRIL